MDKNALTHNARTSDIAVNKGRREIKAGWQDVVPTVTFFAHNPIFTRAHQMLPISHSVQTDGFRISSP